MLLITLEHTSMLARCRSGDPVNRLRMTAMDHRGTMGKPNLRWDEDEDRFEKILRHTKPRLPVGSERARRSAKETYGSKRVRKLISRTTGGMHRRRQKKVQ